MPQQTTDTIIGIGAAGVGGAGTAFQMATQIGSLILIGLNIVLALGGIYLVWTRLRKSNKPETEPENK